MQKRVLGLSAGGVAAAAVAELRAQVHATVEQLLQQLATSLRVRSLSLNTAIGPVIYVLEIIK